MLTQEQMIMQSLATANNYLHTGRPNKALEMLSLIDRVAPDHPITKQMMDFIVAVEMNQPRPDLVQYFGENWAEQDLSGKSIEVFCDQGMGDVINLLRYIVLLKDEYPTATVILNCYAFFNELERFIKFEHCIDKFVAIHEPCDYHTNIMSLPALLNGLEFDVNYPVHFKEVIEQTRIPAYSSFINEVLPETKEKTQIGVAWETKANNPLSVVKSIPVELFRGFDMDMVELHCLLPVQDVPDFMTGHKINDLLDTAHLITQMDLIVSVDTVVLHLAGSLYRRTFALLPYDADPRWGSMATTVWYPTVDIFRQGEDRDWNPVIQSVKNNIVAMHKIR